MVLETDGCGLDRGGLRVSMLYDAVRKNVFVCVCVLLLYVLCCVVILLCVRRHADPCLMEVLYMVLPLC
jgi:hypothetical protein